MRLFFILSGLISLLGAGLSLRAEEGVDAFLGGDTIFNQLDAQGRRVGHWMRLYRNGKPAYRACFAEGRPVGTTRRYDEQGRLTATMEHREKGGAYVRLYGGDGALLGEGLYYGEAKDSVWVYYGRGRVLLREGWKRGKRDGVKEEYLDNGVLRRRERWMEGRMHGVQEEFYPNGAIRSVITYDRDLAEGGYRVYYPGGQIRLEGSYRVDDRDGVWRMYAADGSVEWEVSYSGGVASDDRMSRAADSVARRISGRPIRVPELEDGADGMPSRSLYDRWEQ